jgi:hypothetical protein
MKKGLLLLVLFTLMVVPSMGHAFFLTFEEGYGHDQTPIVGIPGVAFIITGGYNWIYGDSSTGNWNTRSIDLGYGSGGYQHYGNVFAFLGTDNNAGSGIVDFTNNDGTWFQTGYTSTSNFYLEGYDSNNSLIASTFGGANFGGADMTFLRIDAPSGQFFSYVKVHDTGNYFLVDNMSGNATGIPDQQQVPEPTTILLLGLGVLGLAGLKKRKMK